MCVCTKVKQSKIIICIYLSLGDVYIGTYIFPRSTILYGCGIYLAKLNLLKVWRIYYACEVCRSVSISSTPPTIAKSLRQYHCAWGASKIKKTAKYDDVNDNDKLSTTEKRTLAKWEDTATDRIAYLIDTSLYTYVQTLTTSIRTVCVQFV